jgi:signal transduction histidine kinase/ligand-binding sensor domain-containing protein
MRRAILSLLLLPLALLPARAGQLPVRNYTTADGLAHERVRCIVRDSRGFLWFCTGDGLSRFDGYGFTNYGVAEGLAQPAVNQLVEGRGGVYWLATAAGVALFAPSAGRERGDGGPPTPAAPAAGKSRFTFFKIGDDEISNRVQSILADRTGRVWAGTQSGIYFADESADGRRDFRRLELPALPSADSSTPGEVSPAPFIFSLLEDAEGSVWIGASTGLFRHTPDGRVLAYAFMPDGVTSLGTDREGRLWVGFGSGFAVVRPEPPASAPVAWRVKSTREQTHWPDARLHLPDAVGEACVYGADDGLTKNSVWAMRQTGDGRMWLLTRYAGLLVLDGGRLRRYTNEQGLVDKFLNAVEVDAAGNLWIGTEAYGALKIARHGFESFSKMDGIGRTFVRGFLETRAGELVAVTRTPNMFRFEGERFVPFRLNLPEGTPHLRYHGNEFPLQDHLGEWWVMTGAGLYRFPSVARVDELAAAQPVALYTESNGLPARDLTAIFEDSRGNLWIGTEGRAALTHWERSTSKFQTYAETDGVPAAGSPTAFGEDRAGNVWVGFREHGLLRCDAPPGRCTRFGIDEGVPPGAIRSIYLDSSGRLWASTSLSGFVLVEDPTAPRPAFKIYSTGQGLSSANARSVVEDELGRLYFATVRGVDRLDQRTGQVRHFTTADGLSYSEVGPSLRDRSGALWFTTYSGLSRYVPDRDEPQPPSPTLVRGLTVAGVPYNVSELGEGDVSGLLLGPEQSQVQIDFFSLSFATGETLRYQYRLEGQDADWGAPSGQRSVSLRLAPGSYRFAVRAVNADGVPSPQPAYVSFRILPPVWRRWWFVALCALAFGVVAFVLRRHFAARRRERERAEAELRRAKEERLAELERVRKRIATDLHDDIGSSLTQIAVLSEVARQRAGAGAEQLAQISAVSNELVESMSDIVWAINPKKDRPSDLTQRMRRFASDVFTARGMHFHFDAPVAPVADGDIRLGADLRREVFLIFKESVNNAVKHSGASRAEVEFRLEGGELLLRVADDGRGFDASGAALSGEYERTVGGNGGNGLYSLFRRARELGGEYEIRSAPGAGTTVSLRVPVGRPRTGNGDDHHPNGW